MAKLDSKYSEENNHRLGPTGKPTGKSTMKKGGGVCCAAVNCKNTQGKEHLSFFRFPLDPEMSQKWVKQTQRPDLLSRDADYLYNNLKLCAEHFEDSMFMTYLKNRLHKSAVPSLFQKPDFNSPYKKVRRRWTAKPTSSEKMSNDVYKEDTCSENTSKKTCIEDISTKEEPNEKYTLAGSKRMRRRMWKYPESDFEVSYPKKSRRSPAFSITTTKESKDHKTCASPKKAEKNIEKYIPLAESLSKQVMDNVFSSTSFKKSTDMMEQRKSEKTVQEMCAISSTADKVIRLPNNSIYYEFATPKRQVVLQLKSKITELRCRSLDDLLNSLWEMDLLSSECYHFLNTFREFPDGMARANQVPVTRKGEKIKFTQFAEDVVKFAMLLYLSSPDAFDIISKEFQLPDKSFLRLKLQNKTCLPGFSGEAVRIIKNQIVKNKANRMCSLMFESFTLKECISYDDSSGSWTGYVDFGLGSLDTDEIPLATNVLMFCVVGIESSWKLPFGYFFYKELGGKLLKNLVQEAVCVLENTGLDVEALVCSGSPSSIEMLKSFGCDMKSSSEYHTAIPHPTKLQRKISVVFSIRQAVYLLQKLLKDKEVIRSCTYGKVKWSVLEEMLHGKKQVSKLGESRPECAEFYLHQKLIRLTRFSFSLALSSALELAGQLKLDGFHESQGTCQFVADVHRGFDLLNSRNPVSHDDNPPICEEMLHEQIESMTDIAERLMELELLSGNSIVEGGRWMSVMLFAFTLKSVRNLAAELMASKKIRYLPTYRLNLDHLDMVMSHLQRLGGWSEIPTALEFVNAYRTFIKSHRNWSYKYDFEGGDLTVGQGEIYPHGLPSFSNKYEFTLSSVQSCYIIQLDMEELIKARCIISHISKRLSCVDCLRIMLDCDSLYDEKRSTSIANINPSRFLVKLLRKSESLLNSLFHDSCHVDFEQVVSFIYQEFLTLYERIELSDSALSHMKEDPHHIICLIKVIIRSYVQLKQAKRRKLIKQFKYKTI